MSNLRPVLFHNTHEGDHVVLCVHDVGDHAVLDVRLGERARKVVRQTPHLILFIINPSVIHGLINFNIVSIINTILI